MKKFLLMAVVAIVGLSSCTVVTHSAYTGTVDTQMYNRSTADLDVSDKIITTTYNVSYADNRGGLKSIKDAAIQQALAENGGGDLIVNPQFEIKKSGFLWWRKYQYVKVTGHVARYKNIHPLKQSEADIIVTLKNRKK